MSLGKLEDLQGNLQKELLLAEAIGWLHDYRKCSEEHLQAQAPNSKTQALPRTELTNKQPNLQYIYLALPAIQQTSRTVADLLDDRTWRQDTLGQFLSRCHNTAHFDKQEPIDGEQGYPGTQISSPFGFEKPVGINLTNNLWNLPWQDLGQIVAQRQNLQESLQKLFRQTVADSRRPINEVDLWSWGALVGALYKAALAGALLTGAPPAAPNLQWRLLSVRVDGLGYISNVARIPDLLARQRLLEDTLDQVCTLLEVEYPLGSEIYRDHNGSVFVVPDVPGLLQITDRQGETLQEKIVQVFIQKTEGDLIPEITLEQDSWWGQDPNWSRSAPTASNDKLPNIRDMLTTPVVSQVDVQTIHSQWQGKDGNGEVCPVCRLRPMREGREACKHCENRRDSRIAAWQQDPHRTIWMDEIADHNDRVALIVGKFGLDDWLSGDLVQTMLVKADPASNTFVPKNPSPARLRRVWETCQQFWTETVEQEILARHDYSKGDAVRCARWLVIPNQKTGWKENVPYDGTVNGKAISLLWQEKDQSFVTISNLQWVGELQQGAEITVAEPDDPSRKITFTVQDVKPVSGDMGDYAPYLPLPASPDRFLAFIPAADALEIADKIRGEYEEQFGKVRNRLPLFLGIVFFPRKTPLLVVMDTARRMLETSFNAERWTVECCRPENQGEKQYVRLSQGDRRIAWSVAVKMGDYQTDDVWYPYYFVERFDDGTPDHRTYRFQHNGRWLVHVKELKEGDVVSMPPSRFAYLWLEHTARRFAFDPEKDVMLLDELPCLKKLWEDLKHSGITDTGLRNLQALLEVKERAWGKDSVEFAHLVDTALKDAGLYARKDKDGHPLPDVVKPEDVLSGRFFRCLELYLHILKQKMKED